MKADGYGLGIGPVGGTLWHAGCRRFFVAYLEEGIALRRALPGPAEIYVLDGLMGGDTAGFLDAHGLVPVLNTPDDIARWGEHARRKGGRKAILSVDTGMLRLGLSAAEVAALGDDASPLDGIEIEYVMSHLASAENSSDPRNETQRRRFEEARGLLPAAKGSIANSAGTFLGVPFHYDLCRPGAALFGVSRSTGALTPMKQVVGLKGKILQVRVVDSESAVGYGATCRVPAGARLATVAAGYADGYLRALSNRGHGYAGGVRVPVVGRISMDLITFDISDVPEGAIGPGSDIDLLCAEHTVDDLAEEAGTIGYEILTALGSRYRRIYTGGPAA